MASSNDLASIDSFRHQHQLQPSFADLWNPDQTDSLSKSPIEPTYGNNNQVADPDYFHRLLALNQLPHNSFSPFSSDLSKPPDCAAVTPTTTTTPTLSNVSASDLEISTTPKRLTASAKGRITKRKSRAIKKNQTTFITADPANFRQMVQQVTGIRFDNSSQLLLKPEPLRPVPRPYSSCLPTLDTSSFLLDRQMQGQTNLATDNSIYGTGLAAAYGGGEDGGGGYGCSFPTLESWKVM